MNVVLRADQLADRIRADAVGAPKAILKAMKASAHRGRALLVSISPVDRGILRNAWKVIQISEEQVNLENDQPYAGVLERGARPFMISKEGLEALAAWVRRKLLGGKVKSANKKGKRKKLLALWQIDDEAKKIAWAIAKKWQRYGKEGKFFVRDNIRKLAELMNDEMNRCLSEFFNRGAGK